MGADTASCWVFTGRDGILSSVGHDLKLAVTRFSIAGRASPGGLIEASFDTASLRVVAVWGPDGEDRARPSASDRAKIERSIQDAVLESARFPTASFVSTAVTREGDGFVLEGALTLHGTTRTVRTRVVADGDHYECRVALDQRDFGITPYRAFFGGLRVAAVVHVVVRVPRPSPPAP